MMKRKLSAAILSVLALCLLLWGMAAAADAVSDDGCWSFDIPNYTITAFHPAAPGAGEYYKAEVLTVPASVTCDGHSYSVKAIGGDFTGAGSARKIVLPEGLENIGESAFKDMDSLTEITLPSTLIIIGPGAFRGCTALKNITIPTDALSSIDLSAFWGTAGLVIDFQGTLAKWDQCAGGTVGRYYALQYAIHSKVNTTDGVSLGWCGGEENSGNEMYWTLSDGRLTIGGDGHIENAGWNPEEVQTLVIGGQYTALISEEAEDYAWLEQMIHLKSIEVDPQNSMLCSCGTTAGGVLFSKNKSVLLYCPRGYTGSVLIPDGLHHFSSFAFKGCRGVTGLVPEDGSVNYKGQDGFILTTDNYPDGRNKLFLCPPYRNPVVLPVVAEATINTSAFDLVYATTGALNVMMPDQIVHTSGAKINDFKGTFTATFQDGVETIRASSFSRCPGLTSVKLPDTVKTIGEGAFQECTGLTSLTLPDHLKSIGAYAFEDCTGLTSLTLPDELETIEYQAFKGCSGLRTLDIPKSVTKIGPYAFEDCTGLTDVYYPGTAAEWAEVEMGNYAFPSSAAIHTFDNQTDHVSVNLTGLDAAAGDRITLTDEKGTVRNVNASGSWTFWNFGAKMTITPGAGRRISYGAGVEGESSAVRTTNYPVTLPMDTGGGVPEVHVTFEPDDGQEVYHLFVSEEKLDTIGNAPDPTWSLTYNGQSFGNGDILLIASTGQSGQSEMRMFTLTLTPNGYGCAGGIYNTDGKLLRTVSDGTEPVTFEVNSDVTLRLTWYDRSQRATLTYDGNGSTGGMAAQPALNLYATLARNGFDGVVNSEYQLFTGWSLSRDGTGTLFQPGTLLNNLTGDTTVYARWTPAWRVRLMPNGGEGSETDLRIPKSEDAYTLPAYIFTRPGKAIAGWNTKSGGTGTSYAPGETVPLTKNLTLYAQWADAWTVTFDPNGGSGEAFSLPAVKGIAMSLPDGTGFAMNQYEFDGWSTADGTYPAGSFTPAADCTLFARWKRTVFDIHSDGTAAAMIRDEGAEAHAVSQAAENTELSLRIPENAAPPDGQYFTGEFALNNESLGSLGGESGPVPRPVTVFTMPAGDVCISALRADRESLTLDFIAGSPRTLPYTAWMQLVNSGEWAVISDAEGHEYIDLNGNSTPDLAVTGPDGGTAADYTLARMPAADAAGTFGFSFSGITDRFSAITLILPGGPAFGQASFTLPDALTTIQANAFEGDTLLTAVDAHNCTSIGPEAFRGCTGLTQIRTAKECRIDGTAFDGCGTVYLYAPAGGSAQAYCSDPAHHCVFVEE